MVWRWPQSAVNYKKLVEGCPECALCSLAAGWACIWLKATNNREPGGSCATRADSFDNGQKKDDISTFGLRGFWQSHGDDDKADAYRGSL
jgi:hypothetical protein